MIETIRYSVVDIGKGAFAVMRFSVLSDAARTRSETRVAVYRSPHNARNRCIREGGKLAMQKHAHIVIDHGDSLFSHDTNATEGTDQ
jgi:hypothetical protein